MILINGEKLDITTFPNGEVNIKGENILKELYEDIESEVIRKHAVVHLFYENDSDLIHLMMVKKFIDENFTEIKIRLVIPYMPYSRMDRTEGYNVFTLKYVCSLINSLNFDCVKVGEPHSDVCIALLDRCTCFNITDIIAKTAMISSSFNPEKDYIYFPDASAQKHFEKRFANLGYKTLTGLKQRDFKTGRITKLEVAGELPKESGFKVMMVDDLCSYGGTFLLGAEKLIKLGASEIYLAVAHCEDSIFKGNMFKSNLIDKVFTSDSMRLSETNDRLSIIYKLGE